MIDRLWKAGLLLINHRFNANGNHLLVCERFQCGNKYFKYPKNYCVPWNKVCNGFWECPAGADEKHCNRTNCPGQYKCHNTAICIALEDICDTKYQCLAKDDEILCEDPLPRCKDNCVCLLFSISCHNFDLI